MGRTSKRTAPVGCLVSGLREPGGTAGSARESVERPCLRMASDLRRLRLTADCLRAAAIFS
eukprot:5193372-Prymnesium_polylepis.1